MNQQRKRRGSGSYENRVRAALAIPIAVTFVASCLAGCASTSQGRSVETSGFLRDYSKLQPGAEGQAQLVYANPAADFTKYSKIVMDPIVVHASDPGSSLSKVPADELKSIVDYLDTTVREHLQGDYTFVTTPGADTMRLRIAITEAKGANVLLSAASTVTPAGLALNGLKKAVTGASTGVAQTSCEMELLDSATNTQLAAAVDSRVGGKTSSFSKWQAVQEAYDYWAERLRTRLMELRTR